MYGNQALGLILHSKSTEYAGVDLHLEDYLDLVGKEVLTPEEADRFEEISQIIFKKIQSGELDIHQELQSYAHMPFITQMLRGDTMLIKYFTDHERRLIKLLATRDEHTGEVIFKRINIQTQIIEAYTTGHGHVHGSIVGDAYASSRFGAIYTVKYADYHKAPERIQHSSYMGGKAVLCAGMIRVENGRLKHIDNGSGHYQPTTENLLSLLRTLDAKGFNLNEVTTQDLNNKTIYFQGMETLSQNELADYLMKFCFNAKQFLDSNGIVMVKEPSTQIPGRCRIKALL